MLRSRWVLPLLALMLAARYRVYVFSPAPLVDEQFYVDAGRAMQLGNSPYQQYFLYLPAFAWLVGKFLGLFGEGGFLALLRAANVFSAAVFVWLGAAKSGLEERPRLLLAAGYLLLAPAVASSIGTGNPTFLVGLLIFAALERARRPFVAGFLLGASLLVKPLAPGAVAWLAGCRAERKPWGLPIAFLASSFFLLGLLPLHLAPAFLKQTPPGPSLEHNPSVYRLLETAGLPLSPAPFVALICLLALCVAARRPRQPDEVYLLALPFLFLASPLVWNHTLCLSWPIQAAALGRALQRRRGLEIAAVALAMLLLAFWHGIHALPAGAALARWLFVAAPAAMPFVLAAYRLRVAEIAESQRITRP